VIVVLEVEGKMTLFTIFPMGATMQDGGKRKKVLMITFCLLHLYLNKEIQNKEI